MSLLNITILLGPHRCTPSDAGPPLMRAPLCRAPADALPSAPPHRVPLAVWFCEPRALATEVLYNSPTGKDTRLDLSTTEQHFLHGQLQNCEVSLP